jgi:hypothetical protein
MNSATVLAGDDGFTAMMNGARSMLATGTMSRMKLKLSLSYSVALNAFASATSRQRVAVRRRAQIQGDAGSAKRTLASAGCGRLEKIFDFFVMDITEPNRGT